jgi:hypothetical protein
LQPGGILDCLQALLIVQLGNLLLSVHVLNPLKKLCLERSNQLPTLPHRLESLPYPWLKFLLRIVVAVGIEEARDVLQLIAVIVVLGEEAVERDGEILAGNILGLERDHHSFGSWRAQSQTHPPDGVI